MSKLKTKARYLAALLALTALIVAGASTALAHGDDDRSGRTTGEGAMGAMMGGTGMGSMMPMMGGEGMGSMMSPGQMQPMGSFDEARPFDLQFIDQMVMHHQGAITSSEHMISGSERSELRKLAESIQESQSEQMEQMQEWRKEWYPDAERTSG